MGYFNKAMLIASAALCFNLSSFAQDISLKINDVTVKDAIEQLKKTSGYSFVFSSNDINTKQRVSISANNAKIEDVVKQILKGQEGITFEIQGKNIVIKRVAHTPLQKSGKINGNVVDVNGNPIIGATVMEKGTSNGTITDFDGNFMLNVSNNSVLEISYVGYKSQDLTPVFNKSEVVFGINLLKKLRDENRGKDYDGLENLIIVEGQIDVITMHQFGFENTVACLGTAITPMHARKLKQFSENIILLLDGDGAGQKATLRSIDVLRSVALNVRVCRLPEGKDPDEFLHTYGAEAMKKLLADSTDGVEFKIDVLAKKYDLNEPNERAKFVQESLVVVKNLENSSEQDIYLPIIHKYSSTPIDILRIDLSKIDDTVKPYYEREDDDNQPKPPKPVKKDGFARADLFVLASVLYNKEYARNQDLNGLWFEDKGLNDAYGYVMQAISNNNTPNISGLYSFMEVDNSTPLLLEMVNYEFLPDPFPEISFRSCLLKNKGRAVQKLRDEYQIKCATSQDKEERDKNMQEAINLTKKLEELKQQIDVINTEYSAKMNNYIKQKSKRPKED